MKVFQKALTSINKIITKTSELESEGRYQEALMTLKPFWGDFTKIPEDKNLSEIETAELYLRCSSLLGFLDPYKSLTKGQDVFELLLEKAESLFIKQNRDDKLTECRIVRTLGYYYANRINCARENVNLLKKDALGQKTSGQLFVFIIECWLDIAEEKFSEIINKSEKLQEVFRLFGNDILKGCFKKNLGIARLELNEVDEAKICFEEARNHFEKAGQKLYLGETLIYLANLSLKSEKFVEAFQNTKLARDLFIRIEDRVGEAQALCWRSKIYFEQKDFGNSLLDIDDGIKLLEQTRSYKLLLDAYLLKTKTLINLRRFYESFKVMTEASSMSSAYLTDEEVKMIPKEMGKQFQNLLNFEESIENRIVSSKKSYIVKDIKIENFQLVLPTTLSTEIDYFTVEIEDFSLVKFGLDKGVLSVIAAEKVNNQDLIVLFEEGKDEVVFGIYEEELKLVTVEKDDGNCLFYAEEDVKILGKVIGFCNPPKHFNEELEVHLI